MCHKPLVPVSLAALPWGNGSLHESSAEWVEMRIIFCTQECQILWKALYDWMLARQAREAHSYRRIEKKSRESTSEAREVESGWKWKWRRKTRRESSGSQRAYVCLYSNSSVMWFGCILMSLRIIFLICQCSLYLLYLSWFHLLLICIMH